MQSLYRATGTFVELRLPGFGGSEGQRGQLIHLSEVEDARCALTFLSVQPEVDPGRLRNYWEPVLAGAWSCTWGAIRRAAKAIVALTASAVVVAGLRNHAAAPGVIDFLELLDQERIQACPDGSLHMSSTT